MLRRAPPIEHKVEARVTHANYRPAARSLYGGEYPRLVGISKTEVAKFFDSDTGNDRYPALYIDDNLHRSYGETIFNQPRKLMDPVLGHLHLHPRFSPNLPFLKPLNHLSGLKGGAVLDLLNKSHSAHFAFNALRSPVDDEAKKYFDKHLHDWPAYMHEGEIPCDRCASISENPDELCPCFFVNLGSANKVAPKGYKLNCYRCAQVNQPCTYTVVQDHIVFKSVALYARFVPDPALATSLEHKVWWKGMWEGEVTRAAPGPLNKPEEYRRPVQWDEPRQARKRSRDDEQRVRPSKRTRQVARRGATVPVQQSPPRDPGTPDWIGAASNIRLPDDSDEQVEEETQPITVAQWPERRRIAPLPRDKVPAACVSGADADQALVDPPRAELESKPPSSHDAEPNPPATPVAPKDTQDGPAENVVEETGPASQHDVSPVRLADADNTDPANVV